MKHIAELIDQWELAKLAVLYPMLDDGLTLANQWPDPSRDEKFVLDNCTAPVIAVPA